MFISSNDIIKFVEDMKKTPVKENPENMSRFRSCVALAHHFALSLDNAEVLPVVYDPTFHHSMTVHVICKQASIEGHSLEFLKKLVRQCNVFTVETTCGEEPYRFGFAVSHIWEAVK